MAPITNKRIILKEYPRGLPVLGQTIVPDINRMIDLDNVPLNGGVLLKTLVVGLEPYMLTRMKPASHHRFEIEETIQGSGVGVVLRSENPAFQVGDHLHGLYPFQEYVMQHEAAYLAKINNIHNLPWSVFVGAAGMTGQTAYFGWKEYSRAKEGEVAFVSSGAGLIGSFVIQLAKRDGMKVIASAGSEDKVQFMKKLGADVAFNYKTTKTSDVLAKEGPVDVYWDNVGGEALEAALCAAARHARIIECGLITEYGSLAKPPSSFNFDNVVLKEISIHGFVVTSLAPKYLETFEREVPALLASKELTYRESVTRGLENAGDAFCKFVRGELVGKAVVIVADPE